MLQYTAYPTIQVPNHKTIEYKVFGDTAYHIETSDRVVQLLHNIRNNPSERIIIEYGDTTTGKLWGDQSSGRISRSMGTIKVPLIAYNSRSNCGEALLDHRIVRMSYAKGKKVFFDITNPSV